MLAPAQRAILNPSPVLVGIPCMFCTPLRMGVKHSTISSSSDRSPVAKTTPFDAFTRT